MLLKEYVKTIVADPDSKIQCGIAYYALKSMCEIGSKFDPPPYGHLWAMEKWIELRDRVDLVSNKIFIVRNNLEGDHYNLGLMVLSAINEETFEFWFTKEITGSNNQPDVFFIREESVKDTDISSLFLNNGIAIKDFCDFDENFQIQSEHLDASGCMEWLIRENGQKKYVVYIDRKDAILMWDIIYNRFHPNNLYRKYLETI